MRKIALTAALTVAALGPASAASGDAWAEFATEVEQGCIAASSDFFTEASATVDPFGCESYGLAIVTGLTPAGTTASILCVMNKQTRQFEIGGELSIDVMPVETAE